MKKITNILSIGLYILTACSSAGGSSVTPATATAFPQPTATEMKVLPTPSSPSDSILWEKLQVTMDKLEVTQDYTTEFGSTRIPPAGQKFLWVHIRLKNTGQVEIDVP